ncbi:hypothetical protein Tco_1354664 [Tanacetum coccineum]
MTAFETRVRHDTGEIYTRLDDEQSGRQLLAGRLNILFRDRRVHERTARLIKTEARMRQKQLTEALKLIKRLQTQMAEFERQQGPAKGPAQPELPEEAGSSS